MQIMQRVEELISSIDNRPAEHHDDTFKSIAAQYTQSQEIRDAIEKYLDQIQITSTQYELKDMQVIQMVKELKE